MIKAFIFDLDGVICFTDEYHYQAWKQLADKEGIYFDKEINNRLRGVSRMESLNIILERSNKSYSEEEKIQLADYKNEIYKKLLEKMSPKDVSDDTLNTLNQLKKLGYKIAIGSSSKNTKFILTKLGIINMFDEIVDGNDIKNSKPDPEVFTCAGKRLGVNPNEAMVVEDAHAGVKAGHDGGFKVAAIGDAKTSDLATYKIDKLSDLLNII